MPFDVTEKRLRNVFGRFGVILSLDMPCFEDSGRSKGVAYIEFQTTKAATKALKLHESRMGARYIEVFESDFTPNTREIADQPPGCKTLFVGNLSHQIEEPALKDFFQTVGVEFESVHWGTDKETGEKKGFAFVDFKDEASAGKAVQAAGKQLLGRTVRLDFHVSNSAWDDDAGAATTPVSGDQDMAAAGSEEAPVSLRPAATLCACFYARVCVVLRVIFLRGGGGR
jgi:RNA recognition motif-containing protein